MFDETELTNDQEHDLLIEALEALKDILNAAGNGQPFDFVELYGIANPILSTAWNGGIRLNGEED